MLSLIQQLPNCFAESSDHPNHPVECMEGLDPVRSLCMTIISSHDVILFSKNVYQAASHLLLVLPSRHDCPSEAISPLLFELCGAPTLQPVFPSLPPLPRVSAARAAGRPHLMHLSAQSDERPHPMFAILSPFFSFAGSIIPAFCGAVLLQQQLGRPYHPQLRQRPCSVAIARRCRMCHFHSW
jgi:hypothetical protein